MKKQLGFTLIEMMVIVAVIGALTAIAFPVVNGVLEQARESADVTALQSADTLITSAALSGKIVDGAPARNYSQEQPLYYDGEGNLTSHRPAPYGKGTGRDGGKSWSCCTDFSYSSGADYTRSVVCCWYDSDTRESHAHWVNSDGAPVTSNPQNPVTPESTFPTFATHPTISPDDTGSGTGGTGGTGNLPPAGAGAPSHSHAFLTREQGDQQWLLAPIEQGHRYYYNGVLYLAVSASPQDTPILLPPDNPELFIPLKTPVQESVTPQTSHPWVLFASEHVLSTNALRQAGSLCFTNDSGNERYGEESNFNMGLEAGDYFIDDTQTPCRIYVLRQNVDSCLAPSGVFHDGTTDLWVACTSNCEASDGFRCGITIPDRDHMEEFYRIADISPFLEYKPQAETDPPA